MANALQVLPHQHAFITDNHTPHLLLCGGYGAGKTKAAAIKAYVLGGLNPGYPGLLVAPTLPLAKSVLMPEFEALLDEQGLKWKLVCSPAMEYRVYYPGGTVIVHVRNFEHHNRMIGFNAAWAVLDEIDTVKPAIAVPAYKKVMGRVRVGKVNQIASVTTPEGFRFAHQFWVKGAVDAAGKPKTDRRLIKARTMDNPFISPDYLEMLRSNYSPEEFDAYTNGLFVNLTNGAIYRNFDRSLNGCTSTIRPGERLHIGLDFNVGKMAAAVGVTVQVADPRWRGERLLNSPEQFHLVAELKDLLDTPAVIGSLKQRFPEHARAKLITIYPDASGNARKSIGASESDIALLRREGFNVQVNGTNPAVKDRINAVNGLCKSAAGVRRLYINTSECPAITDGIEQQPWDANGEPDKSTGHDHMNDALGYAVVKRYPIVGRGAWHQGQVDAA